jgi:hypothetical protein
MTREQFLRHVHTYLSPRVCSIDLFEGVLSTVARDGAVCRAWAEPCQHQGRCVDPDCTGWVLVMASAPLTKSDDRTGETEEMIGDATARCGELDLIGPAHTEMS